MAHSCRVETPQSLLTCTLERSILRSWPPRWSRAALLKRLRDDLGFRRIENGIRTLENLRPCYRGPGMRSRSAGVLVGLVAQWVDAGFDSQALLLQASVAISPMPIRAGLPVHDYLHLRMAEAAASHVARGVTTVPSPHTSA